MRGAITGRIHSFQTLGAVDGPGLRFVVFMQGCPLRCIYCHNPDTWDAGSGTEHSPEEVLRRILRYRPYLREGGVTVSGGEPLMQAAFVRELFRLLKAEGIHTALDTAGIGDLEAVRALLTYTDLVLLDIKFLSETAYLRHTGGSFGEVLAFLELLETAKIPFWVRNVVLPGVNDAPSQVMAMAKRLKDYAAFEKIEFLPFRKLCLEKYEALALPFRAKDIPEPDSAQMAAIENLFWQHYTA